MPLSDSVPLAFVEVVNVTVADTGPAVVGAYTTLTCALCPEFRVKGNDVPEIENCELLLEADETVTLPPVALRVAGWVVLDPISTLPKLKDAGETVNCPAELVAPVPVSGTFRFGPEMNRLPLMIPVVDGEKVAVTVRLWPLLRVIGSIAPLTANPLPLS